MINPISFANIRSSYQKNTFATPRSNVNRGVDEVSFSGRKAINNIIMTQDFRHHFSFFDDGVQIGYAKFDRSDKVASLKGLVPDDWFVEGGIPDARGNYPLKPSVFINELVMDDKVGLTGEYSVRANQKKYGVMCMQRILEWAEEHGFGHRISLCPGKTHSDINPAPFYAKIGFDVAPEISEMLGRVSSAKQIDGRYVSRGQEVFLTNPDVLKKYSLG